MTSEAPIRSNHRCEVTILIFLNVTSYQAPQPWADACLFTYNKQLVPSKNNISNISFILINHGENHVKLIWGKRRETNEA